MKILLSGGGTGGHITPILAVAHELKKLQPDIEIIYVGEHSAKFTKLTDNNPDIDATRTIYAGKFRRYYGESWWRRLIDIRTSLLNIRDFFYFLAGIIQAYFLLGKLKPDLVFLKGSFVGLPVGIAAHFRGMPIITHDSDSMPGLANRVVGRWAVWHATGMPPGFYDYPKDKIQYVGVLVGSAYEMVTEDKQLSYKQQLQLPENSKVLLVTGGSGGAAKINEAIKQIVPQLLERFNDLFVIHQTGINKAGIYGDYKHDRLLVYDLLHPMYVYTGASDVVVSRAGANTIAELGVQAKAAIIIPNPLLTGGHQSKNATYLDQQAAAVVIDERELSTDVSPLLAAIVELLDDPAKRQNLAHKLNSITAQAAANKLAMLLLDTANQTKHVQKQENTT